MRGAAAVRAGRDHQAQSNDRSSRSCTGAHDPFLSFGSARWVTAEHWFLPVGAGHRMTAAAKT